MDWCGWKASNYITCNQAPSPSESTGQAKCMVGQRSLGLLRVDIWTADPLPPVSGRLPRLHCHTTSAGPLDLVLFIQVQGGIAWSVIPSQAEMATCPLIDDLLQVDYQLRNVDLGLYVVNDLLPPCVSGTAQGPLHTTFVTSFFSVFSSFFSTTPGPQATHTDLRPS